MGAYLARRCFYAIFTFLGITLAVFVLIHAVPGDPVQVFIGKHGIGQLDARALQAIRHEHHLDEPLVQQYLWWVRETLTLDFGRSIVSHQPVTESILQKLPNTLILNVTAFLLAALIGVPIGLWSATRSGRFTERASGVLFFLLYSLPSFWVALLLMQFFAVRLQVLPLYGMVSDDYLSMTAGEQLLDRMRHLTLPVITLAYAQLAFYVRFSKSALVEVIRQDFVTTARAKGVGPTLVLWRHAFRNALIPLITLLGLTLPALISGSVIVEQIFEWDGIGRLYFESVLSRDYPVVLPLTMFTAAATLVASLFADVLYAVADPRIRLGAGQ